MSRLQAITVVIVGAWCVQYLTALGIPYGIMGYLWQESTEQYGVNRMTHQPVPDAGSRNVVRPSPDLLYSICPYDLSNGPLRLSGNVPEQYWSLQFYQMNTVNFSGRTNQRDQSWRKGQSYSLTLIGPGHDPDNYRGDVQQAPSQRGVALVRISAIGEVAALRKVQQTGSCAALKPA